MYAATKQRRANVIKSLKIEHNKLVDEMRKEADSLVAGGPVTQKQLDLDGNPFARAGKFGKSYQLNKHKTRRRARFADGNFGRAYDILPINMNQSRRYSAGTLRRSLRVFKRESSQGVNSYLYFTASYAKYILAVGGTKKAIDRGFWKEMYVRYNASRSRLQTATRRARRT